MDILNNNNNNSEPKRGRSEEAKIETNTTTNKNILIKKANENLAKILQHLLDALSLEKLSTKLNTLVTTFKNKADKITKDLEKEIGKLELKRETSIEDLHRRNSNM